MEVRTGRDHPAASIRAKKRLTLERIRLFRGGQQQKNRTWGTSPPPFFLLSFFYLLSAAAQGVGAGGSPSHIGSVAPSSLRTPHALSTLECGVPSMGVSPPEASPAQVLPTEPALVWVSSMGIVLQEGCSSVRMSPAGSQVLLGNLLQHGLLSTGPPMGSQPPSGYPPAPAQGSPHLQVGICSTVDLRGLQGKLCLGALSTTSSSSIRDLGGCRVVSPSSLAAVAQVLGFSLS